MYKRQNVVSEAGIHEYVMLDKEKILEMDPEIIIVEAGGLPLILEDYESDPSFYEGLQAVKNNRLYLQLPYNYYSCNLSLIHISEFDVGHHV